MKLIELIEIEFKNIVEAEIQKQYGKIEAESLLKAFNEQMSFDDIEDTLTIFKQKKFDQLSNSRFFATQINLLENDEYEKIDCDTLEAILRNRNHHKLAAIIWVFYKIAEFKNSEYFDLELAEFYAKAFQYDFLFALDDFLVMSDMLTIKNKYKKWDLAIFEEVFIAACTKYPDKFALHLMLSQLYLNQEQYKQAIEYSNIIINQVDLNDHEFCLEFHYTEYIEAVQIRCIAEYKLGNFQDALADCNFVFDNMPTISFEGEDEEETPYFDENIDVYLVKMSIYLTEHKYDEIGKDYEYIKSNNFGVEIEAWKANYPALFEYFESIDNNNQGD